MKEKDQIKPPSKGSAKDAFGNGATKKKSFEEGLSQAVIKLGKQVDDLKPEQEEAFELNKAAETISSKLGIEKQYIEDAYQNNNKELVKLSDAFVKADEKSEGFAVLGMVSALASLGSGFIALMSHVQFDDFSPVAFGISLLSGLGATAAFKKAVQADKDKKQLTSKVRDRLHSRLEFIQTKQLPPPQ